MADTTASKVAERDETVRPQETGFRHWRIERDAAGVCRLWADCEGSRVNTLSEAMLRELGGIVAKLEADPPAALEIRSAKADGFAVGADVHAFVGQRDSDTLAERIREIHALFARLAALPCPIVAVIHGHCLGGGLELALACDRRVAAPDARLGFPEILLGIHPGFGGTVRTTRLVPAWQAIPLMLTGRTISARRAKKLGLIDDVVPEHLLDTAATRLARRGKPGQRHRLAPFLANSAAARPLIARFALRTTARRVRREHYPAPFALIELWRAHGGDPAQMYAAEAVSVGHLLTGETAQNLVRVFLLRERLRGIGRSEAPAHPRVHVIGAGTMGGDIAAWCALQGLTVTLQDREPRLIAPAIGRADALFRKRLAGSARVQAASDRLIPDPKGLGLGKADIVIEAVPENVELKHTLYRTIEPALKPDAVLATNTSSIPLEQLAGALERPERLIGLHFFNPVAKLPLVELVCGERSDPAALAAGAALVRTIDRLPLLVSSAPGFLVNRALAPYIREAALMVDEGFAPERIDEAARAFGMPIGPLELADSIGLDVCLDVSTFLANALGGSVPEALRSRVEAGHLGRKTGRGFYRWRNGEPKRPRIREEEHEGELQDRLVLPLLDACVACLHAGVVEDADLVDAGLVFGAGFAPFRGGPMHYIETEGPDALAARLDGLARRFGERFRPGSGWTATLVTTKESE